jgi:RNA polymerase sigma-70 factor (ECF subfamily)
VDISSSDQDIILKAQSGDLGAFEVLYTKHAQRVYRTALAILGNPQTAEEVLQDCFLRAYKHLHTLNGDPSISPWLHRVAVNLCYSHLRRSHRARLTVSLESLSNYFASVSTPSPEEDVYRNEIQTAVKRGMASLSFKHRAVIVLHYLQGFAVEDIAYVLNCPVGTVKSRLYHARKMLSRRLPGLRRQPAYELA